MSKLRAKATYSLKRIFGQCEVKNVPAAAEVYVQDEPGLNLLGLPEEILALIYQFYLIPETSATAILRKRTPVSKKDSNQLEFVPASTLEQTCSVFRRMGKTQNMEKTRLIVAVPITNPHDMDLMISALPRRLNNLKSLTLEWQAKKLVYSNGWQFRNDCIDLIKRCQPSEDITVYGKVGPLSLEDEIDTKASDVIEKLLQTPQVQVMERSHFEIFIPYMHDLLWAIGAGSIDRDISFNAVPNITAITESTIVSASGKPIVMRTFYIISDDPWGHAHWPQANLIKRSKTEIQCGSHNTIHRHDIDRMQMQDLPSAEVFKSRTGRRAHVVEARLLSELGHSLQMESKARWYKPFTRV